MLLTRDCRVVAVTPPRNDNGRGDDKKLYMTIAEALKFAANELSAGKINNPPLEAEILLSGILKKPLEFLLTRSEHKLAAGQLSRYQKLLSRRLKGEPVAYLTGHKEFYGLDFLVNKNVLIPRPETELMVEEAINLVPPAGGSSSQPATLIDVGTGSGCIIITLAKLLNWESLRRQGLGGPAGIMNYELWGIDISLKALTVAKQNALTQGVDKKIKFIKGNLLAPLAHNSLPACRQTGPVIYDSLIILANLPYGWQAWKNNCSLDTIGLKFEPAVALFTGHHGLELYEKLFKQIKELRATSYELRDLRALCEFDPRQTKLIKKLIKRELPEAKCQIKKDLSGLNRLAIIKFNS